MYNVQWKDETMADREELGRLSRAAAGFIEALVDILAVAKIGEIPDRHGHRHQACDTTCLADIRETAEKVLARHGTVLVHPAQPSNDIDGERAPLSTDS